MAAQGSGKHPTDINAPASPARVRFAQSLRLRLSLLTTALIAIVIVIFLAAVNRELVQTTRRTGGERALSMSSQIANMMAQNGARGLTQLRQLANDHELVAYLNSPTPALGTSLQSRLQFLAQAGQPAIVLLSAEGAQVLQIAATAGREGPAATITLPSGVPQHLGIGPLRSEGGVLYSDVVVSIGSPDHDEGSTSGRSGFMVLRRIIQAAPNSDLLGRLAGAGATVAMGNRMGSPWTDFVHEIPVPSVDATRSGLSEYTAAGGERRVGGVSVIDGTPWAVWVDLPESLILAPARAFLRRMMILAFGAILLSAGAVTLLSRHVTKPLGDLTRASEAIAAGNYATHVETGRQDEVGRLAQAFNAMVDHVSEGRRELEDRVQRRTARLAETTDLLEQRASELAVVNQELEAFSYSVSHDLRAPLRHVTGFAALLDGSARDKLNDEEHRHLTTIVSAAARMGRLIDDLLAFSRAGRHPIEAQRLSLETLVTAARHELGTEPHFDRVEWAIGPLPDVDGDPAMLELVMVNLIGNALKYTRHQPRPRVEIGARESGPDEVVVYVKDNGAGFDMQYVDRLFGVFQRLHTDEEFEGTGIGLASVRRIIHRHGGRTWAEGAVNQGATFYFSLPQA